MSTSHPEPPDILDEPLELDPDDWSPRQVYHLMTGLVIPRPIAWISTLGPDGVPNVAPHSYFNAVSHDPPHVVFSSSGVKDTLANLRELGQFVVNIVSSDLAEPMNLTAADFPRAEDEFRWAGLTPTSAARVTPPRVAEARAHLECEITQIVPAGNSSVVVARVVHLHVDPSVWREGRVQPELLDPIARLAGSSYASLGEIFELTRPVWSRDLQGTEPDGTVLRRFRRRPSGEGSTS